MSRKKKCGCGRFSIRQGMSIDIHGELHMAGRCVPAEEEPLVLEVEEDMIVERREYNVPPPPPNLPPPGSWAETARFMASIDPDFDWDRWKDEMKDREMMGDNDE